MDLMENIRLIQKMGLIPPRLPNRVKTDNKKDALHRASLVVAGSRIELPTSGL